MSDRFLSALVEPRATTDIDLLMLIEQPSREGIQSLLSPQFDSTVVHPAPQAHIIHERFCCNRGSAAATSLSAGRLAAQSLNVLFQVRVGPSRLRVPVSQCGCAISRRTVMNNVG